MNNVFIEKISGKLKLFDKFCKNIMACALVALAFIVVSCTAEHSFITVLDLRPLNDVNLNDKDEAERMWETLHVTVTLQGIINRDAPRLYIRYVLNQKGQNVDDYWWSKYRQAGEWLAGQDTVAYTDIVEVIDIYKKRINGAVVYDPAVASTSNVASSVAGIENLVAIRYDTADNSLYNRIVNSGPRLEVKCWLVNKDGSSMFTGKGQIAGTELESSGSVKIDPYIWFIDKYMETGKCNTEYAAYYIDQFWLTDPTRTVANHHQLTNHDFFVSKKAFFFDLSPWGDEPATDDPKQNVGLDLQTLITFLEEAYKQNKGETFCHIGGFPSWIYKYTRHAQGKHDDVPTEWEFSRIISAYNAFKDADAIGLGALGNSSFWQHFPLEAEYPQDWITREELKKRGYLNEDGTINFAGRNFILFYGGDFDSSSWIAQTTPFLWDEPARGEVPLMWSVSPVLDRRVPMVMHNYRKTASKKDYFAAADNGAGYLLPGMLQEPRPVSALPSGLDAWQKHCMTYYKKWGLSVTGFIIDGEAPGLNKEGLDCYAAFSPNGIVPQKTPLTSLYGTMPIIRADYDIVDHDPLKATDVVIDRVEKRPVPFHWFRAILKSPTWYKTINDELQKRNTKIELLEAPVFFELYRIYLEQNPDAAGGKIEMN